MQLPKEKNLPATWKVPNQGSCLPRNSKKRRQPGRAAYVGITEGAFKTRYNSHTNLLQDPKHKNSTALSKYIWKLKESKISYAISWKIIKKCRGYSSHTKKCNLCLHEKYIIICHPKLRSLNLGMNLFQFVDTERKTCSAIIK